MSTREDYPAGVPCWVDTNQPDPADAARFYSGLFGWQTEDAMPPDAGAHYYMARIDGRDVAAISSQPPGAPPQAVWNTYIRVESADDAAARVREAGGRVLSEPFDVFDAGRMGVFADPEGAVFCVWQPGSHRGSAAVNEHGAVNFNNLHTDDAGAARAFYGAVFGCRGCVWVARSRGCFPSSDGGDIAGHYRGGPGHHPAGFHQVGSSPDL